MNIDFFYTYDVDLMALRNEQEEINNNIRAVKVKYKGITSRIIQLPNDIQVKIYMYAIKKYQRERILDTPLIPSWMKYKKYVDSELKRSILDNVHFLHLEFNTLPENKEWIPGCQCNFCKDKGGNREWNLLKSDDNFFNKCIH